MVQADRTHPRALPVAEEAPEPVAFSTITIKLVHLASGQTALETFWSGPISSHVEAVAQVLRQAADTVDQMRSPLYIPGGPLRGG